MIDWGYTGRATPGRRRCRKCRATVDVVVSEVEYRTGWCDEVMCVACGATWRDYGGWSPRTWCRPKPGHEAEYHGNPEPEPARPAGVEPMSDEAAAWVRANVWSAAMRKTHRDVPAYRTSCACRFGMSQWCSTGRDHDRCQPGGQLPAPEGYITNRSEHVLYLPEPFEHPSISATGARTTTAAQVWLADRICRWVCPCDCHTRPTAPPPKPVYEAVALPGLELIGATA